MTIKVTKVSYAGTYHQPMRVSTSHFHVALDHKDERASYDGMSASFRVPLFVSPI